MSTTAAEARRLAGLLDLTRLGDADTPADIEAVCARAAGPLGPPAAVCVHPELVCCARRALDALDLVAVPVATVINFPDGDGKPRQVARDTRRALAAGAAEIDLVLPWRALRAGDSETVIEVLCMVREACAGQPLKVILESGELDSVDLIRKASRLALQAGADFLKTSTGKASRHPTLAAAATMLAAIVEHGNRAGLKVSGGIADPAQALAYLRQAETALAPRVVGPDCFRIGASSLLDALEQSASPEAESVP